MDWTGLTAAHGISLVSGACLAALAVVWKLYGRLRSWRQWHAWTTASALVIMVLGLSGGALFLLHEVTTTGSPQLHPLLGTQAPDVPFTIAETGEITSLSAFRGRVILLNLWATWCLPCVAEFPTLDRLHREYSEDGLQIVSLTDEDVEMVRSFKQRFPVEMMLGSTHGVEFESPVYRLLSSQGLPLIAVIDRNGDFKHLSVGGPKSYFFLARNALRWL